ncbi:hypothetical protein OIU74_000952 [Salix koriyanagi]|uniref:FAR1 domain-containing protein n=1 Tax=Salix koriyanagi TaxID=2511006 RepID=A0A9Q1AMW4_9ROSI|nr:hypothetical protein OIU74_000952 [Salix koriyanagi]
MTVEHHPNGKFRVTHFETQHNHELGTSAAAHFLPSQKMLDSAQAAEAELCNGPQIDGAPKLGSYGEYENHIHDLVAACRVGDQNQSTTTFSKQAVEDEITKI